MTGQSGVSGMPGLWLSCWNTPALPGDRKEVVRRISMVFREGLAGEGGITPLGVFLMITPDQAATHLLIFLTAPWENFRRIFPFLDKSYGPKTQPDHRPFSTRQLV